MIKNFKCVNISSKDPKALADFYISIGAPVFIEDGNYEELMEKNGYFAELIARQRLDGM